MTATAATDVLPRALGRLGWGGLLLLDLALLLLLPWAGYVGLAAAGAGLLWALARRPHLALATLAFGLPLLWPLLLIGTSATELFLPQLLVGVPLVGLFWGAAWVLHTPEERSHPLLGALRDPIVLLALLLGVWLALRVWGSPSPSYGRSKALLFWITNVPLLLAAFAFLGGEAAARRARVRSFLRLALVFLAIIAALSLWNAVTEYWPYEARLKALGLNPIWLARLMGMGLLIVLAFPAGGRTTRLLLATLFIGPFYLAGSRGPLLALFLAGAVWWTLGGRPAKRALVASIAGLFAVLLLLALEMGWILPDSPFSGHDVSNLGRVFLLKTALDLGASPGWFGLGTGGYAAATGFGDIRFYPHNLVLEVWIELGVVGLALLAAWALALVRRLRFAPGVAAADRAWVRLAAAMIAFLGCNALISGDLPANEQLWFWAGALGACTRGEEKAGAA